MVSGEHANDETVCMDYPDLIDGLCKYILIRCPNLTDYTLFVNGCGSYKKKFDHLMAFYGKLKSLTTDTSCVFHDGLRMISLKKERILRLNLNI